MPLSLEPANRPRAISSLVTSDYGDPLSIRTFCCAARRLANVVVLEPDTTRQAIHVFPDADFKR